jgi:ElaB/YqjD/DUF883 family membrane-anchored ribosome-binding protein
MAFAQPSDHPVGRSDAPSGSGPDAATEGHLGDMQSLMDKAQRFAVVVGDELAELSSARDTLLAAIESDANRRREEARAGAERILADAQATADATTFEASRRAAEITAEARADYERLRDVNAQYREALVETISVLAGLPEVPDTAHEVDVELSPPDPPMPPEVARRFMEAEKRSP